jgi:hypothetical protein
MRARVHLLAAVAVLMILGLAVVACNDDESVGDSSAAEAKATQAVGTALAEHEAEGGEEGEDEGEGEEGAGTEEQPFEVRRGCPACHRLVEPDTGKYTLGFEAHERAEARGERHPNKAPDGTAIGPTDEPSVSVCLTCHGPSAVERLGADRASPLSMSDIAHPSHLFSEIFLSEYRGNCMSCHNVSEDGAWQLLSEAVEVNEKGVPSPDQVPIPGLLDPSAEP